MRFYARIVFKNEMLYFLSFPKIKAQNLGIEAVRQ